MENRNQSPFRLLGRLLHRLVVLLGAVGLTLAFFLVLPLMQTLTGPPETDLIVRAVDAVHVPPPPPPPPEEPREEPEPDEPPPQLSENVSPLDLSILELALNPGFSEGWLGGDFAVKLNTVVASSREDLDALFSIADLDQEPRVLYQPSPILNREMRKRTPATVHVVFIVDRQGRVESPRVQSSTDPLFDASAIGAVRQWKFEPGKRNGQAVRFRMRVPVTFPKG